MLLPAALSRAVELALEGQGLEALGRAAAALSAAYRAPGQPAGRAAATPAHRLAYLATRLPATYAAAHAVLTEARRLWPSPISSLLDLGAGPGTAAWAATALYPEIERVTLVESDQAWIRVGRSLAAGSGCRGLEQATWMAADLRAVAPLPAHDLVVASYALGELQAPDAVGVLDRAWAAAGVAVVVVEPGTTTGFALVRQVRTRLVELGGHLVAPCPHARECPLPPGDWCHFAQRVERSAVHRRLKDAALGYEDEKHSYIAASRVPAAAAAARVLRHPLRRPGHVRLELCGQSGLCTRVVPRSDRAHWSQARRANWGDAWAD